MGALTRPVRVRPTALQAIQRAADGELLVWVRTTDLRDAAIALRDFDPGHEIWSGLPSRDRAALWAAAAAEEEHLARGRSGSG